MFLFGFRLLFLTCLRYRCVLKGVPQPNRIYGVSIPYLYRNDYIRPPIGLYFVINLVDNLLYKVLFFKKVSLIFENKGYHNYEPNTNQTQTNQEANVWQR